MDLNFEKMNGLIPAIIQGTASWTGNENAGYHSISHHSGDDDEGRRYYDRSGGKFR